MKKNILILLVLICIFVGVAAFFIKGSRESSNDVIHERAGKIKVVASFYPLYFFSSKIGGEKAAVTNIVPAGSEPHDYEPTAQDMAGMENSKLIVLNGGGLEAWGDSIGKNIDTGKTIIIDASEGLTTLQTSEDGEYAIDPHVWIAPLLAEKMIDRIAQGFKQADSANEGYYQANADALKSELADLDAAYRQGLGNCQEKNIITSHSAFGYLAAAYGFKQVSIAGLSPDAEPSSQQLAGIAKFAKDNNVKYIFFESLASPKLSQTIASEVGAQTLVLDPIEGLTDQELAQGEDYITVMHDNLINLRTALLCK